MNNYVETLPAEPGVSRFAAYGRAHENHAVITGTPFFEWGPTPALGNSVAADWTDPVEDPRTFSAVIESGPGTFYFRAAVEEGGPV